MKLGVMSDSHDNVPKVEAAVELFNRRGTDLVIHAGDFVAPFAVAPLAKLERRWGPNAVMAVFGNNDGERVGLARTFEKLGEVHPNLLELEIGGRRVAVTHYPEVAEPISLSDRFDLVVYGHTHEIDLRRRGGTLILNPGEVGGWLTGRTTVAIVDLKSLEAEILDLP